MCFQPNQRDVHASTMAGSTRLARASVLVVNTNAPASTALSAVLLSIKTSCHLPRRPACTHSWLGSIGSAASAWTAVRASGGCHISFRFHNSDTVVFLQNYKRYFYSHFVIFNLNVLIMYLSILFIGITVSIDESKQTAPFLLISCLRYLDHNTCPGFRNVSLKMSCTVRLQT